MEFDTRNVNKNRGIKARNKFFFERKITFKVQSLLSLIIFMQGKEKLEGNQIRDL
jgi:hypothetical protein